MKIINQCGSSVNFQIVNSGNSSTLDSGTMLNNETYFNGNLPAGNVYTVVLNNQSVPNSSIVFMRPSSMATITAQVTNTAPPVAVDYGSTYTMQLTQGVQLFPGDSGAMNWVELDTSRPSLTFVKQSGASTGPMVSGDTLTIVFNERNMYARGTNGDNVRWYGESTPSSSSLWTVWADTAMTQGLPIMLGQAVYFYNPHYGNFLVQDPGSTSYLTVEAPGVAAWVILDP